MSELYQRRFATDDECSLLSATPPRPEATAAIAPRSITIAVTGTCPLKNDLVAGENLGIECPRRSDDVESGDGRRLPPGVRTARWRDSR